MKKLVLPIILFLFSFSTNFIYSQCFTGSSTNTAYSPMSLVEGDFNKDGNMDFVEVGFYNSNSEISIYLGNGNGTFSSPSNISTGGKPYGITKGDFNKDGNLDIAVGNSASNNLQVFLGNGAGGFSTPTSYLIISFYTQPQPHSLCTDDFNEDGNLDIAVGMYNSPKMSVLFGDGNGLFSAPSEFQWANAVECIKSGDFNNDNHKDIAVMDSQNGKATIFIGNGVGGFSNQTSYASGYQSYYLDLADFNNDGKLDICTANWGTSDFSILLGKGDGTFFPSQSFASSNGSCLIRSVDINLDGNQDIILGYWTAGVSIYMGDGSGNYSSSASFSTGSRPHGIALGDFNNDNEIDIITGNRNSTSFTVLLNTPLPLVNASVSDSVICKGDAVTFTQSGNADSYSWSDGIINNSAYTPDTTKTYTLTGTTNAGCVNKDLITVSLNELPYIKASVSDSIICKGEYVTLSALTDFINYTWLNGAIEGLPFQPLSTQIYSVSVTDTNLCTTISSINVQVLSLPNVVAHATVSKVCDGGSTVLYSTGNASTYSWSHNVVNTVSFNPTTPNNYVLTGVGSNGCVNFDTIFVDVRKQQADITNYPETHFSGCDAAFKANGYGGYGASNYTWKNSSQSILSLTDSVSNLCSGNYILTLTDSISCVKNINLTVNAATVPQTPDICLVSVDSTFTHNIIVWEKTLLNLTNVDSFIVYRELTTNNYVRIGAVHVDSLSEFEDFNSNPNITGYRYKINMKDIYGIESLLSLYHNTIYLNYLGNGVLSWTQYQVESSTTPVSSYDVYRDSLSTGNFRLIGSTTGNQFGFTDVDYFQFDSASYFVKAVRGAGECVPSRARIATSRSNVKNSSRITQLTSLTNENTFIFPNPANNLLNIEMFVIQEKITINLYDAQGKLVYANEYFAKGTFKTQLNISDLAVGAYHLQLITDKGVLNKKIIKN